MRDPIPPLKSLRYFACAARHLSLSKAADELHVTHSAISHQIKALEEWLGVKLFRRANRQVILHRIREVFSRLFRRSPEELGMSMVYDVAHNTAKLEKHLIGGEMRQVLVHRKGARRRPR